MLSWRKPLAGFVSAAKITLPTVMSGICAGTGIGPNPECRRFLSILRVEKHPDKTFISKACRGFDFLGDYFLSGTTSVSRPALRRFAERITRLYEQGAATSRVEQYVRRWRRWVWAGLRDTMVGPLAPNMQMAAPRLAASPGAIHGKTWHGAARAVGCLYRWIAPGGL